MLVQRQSLLLVQSLHADLRRVRGDQNARNRRELLGEVERMIFNSFFLLRKYYLDVRTQSVKLQYFQRVL